MLPPCGRDDSRFGTATEEEKLAQVVEVRDGYGSEQATGDAQLPAPGTVAGAGRVSALSEAQQLQQNGAGATATYRHRVRLVYDVGVLTTLAIVIALRCST